MTERSPMSIDPLSRSDGAAALPWARPSLGLASRNSLNTMERGDNGSPRGGNRLADPLNRSDGSMFISRAMSQRSHHSEVDLDASLQDLTGNATFGDWRVTAREMRLWRQQRELTFARQASPRPESVNDDGTLCVQGDGDSVDFESPIERRSGNLRSWFAERVGTPMQMCLVSLYVITQSVNMALKQADGDSSQSSTTSGPTPGDSSRSNATSVNAVGQLSSLLIALTLSFSLEGREAIPKVFNLSTFVRFFGIACLFNLATIIGSSAPYYNASAAAVTVVGYVYLPTAALLSLLVFERNYGRLEWLALGIMSCAVIAYVDLDRQGLNKEGVLKGLTGEVFVLLAVGAMASALASVLAERLYKNRSRSVQRLNVAHRFYIYKVHIDLASLIVTCAFWVLPTSAHEVVPAIEVDDDWFGTWGIHDVETVCTTVAQAWLAGLLVKHFSTVFRSIVDSLVKVIGIFFSDVILSSHDFHAGGVACWLLLVMVIFSAMIFQTGRLNIKALREAINGRMTSVFNSEADLAGNAGGPDAGASLASSTLLGGLQVWLSDSCDQVRECIRSSREISIVGYVLKYGSMLLFVMSDAARSIITSQALSKTAITTQTLVLVTYMFGVGIATCMTITSSSNRAQVFRDLKKAWSVQRLLKCFPCAFFFALAQTLSCLAYAEGISAALNTALGYVYMPISALASRWVLDKYYMWLEWFALLVLTCGSATFGLIQSTSSSGEGGSQLIPCSFVIASAATSVLASLVAEKFLKAEQVPFHIQKVSLDLGSVFASMIILPVIGVISDRGSDGFWNDRPLCLKYWPDTTGCFPQVNRTSCNVDCQCDCGHGLFVGWSSYLVWLALFINIAQGWLTGVVIKQFSTVLRAIAQSTTLLMIYFVGNPLVVGPQFDWPSTLLTFTIPLSTATFMYAVSEQEKVMEALRPPDPVTTTTIPKVLAITDNISAIVEEHSQLDSDGTG